MALQRARNLGQPISSKSIPCVPNELSGPGMAMYTFRSQHSRERDNWFSERSKLSDL